MDQQRRQVIQEIVVEGEKPEILEHDWNELFKKGKIKKEDMDMMVMDFLVNKEFARAAESFHKESGCPLGIEDTSLLETQRTVKDLIFHREMDEVIDLLNEKLGPIFLKERPDLHFRLEQQKMIELCREEDFEAALAFSHEFIKWDKNVDLKKECRRTLLLMMFGNDTDCPVAALLLVRRYYDIEMDVIEEMIKFQGRETGNLIERAMKMLKLEQAKLSFHVNFPHLNNNGGYPSPLPHQRSSPSPLHHRRSSL
ncbi:glucose-induced degradation protein 8 [Artemisia annua]|uniref:Glucose-induced degradation protein 8 n=1 Tax=Artemisia annua TaxID=35608 RepID=A0A2U1KF33_ARTAN|nr:glucose-induced degradation protein 8 [Artemisia annua]